MPIVGDPLGTQARALDAERQHPGHGDVDPPASYGWKQLVVLVVVIAIPVGVYLLTLASR